MRHLQPIKNDKEILRELRDHENGLSYNQLKRKVYEKSLRKQLPLLHAEGYITINPLNAKRGQKKTYKITARGLKYLSASGYLMQLEVFFKEFDHVKDKDKFSGLSGIIAKLFEYSNELFLNENNIEVYREFWNSVSAPIKTILNSEILQNKSILLNGEAIPEDIIKKHSELFEELKIETVMHKSFTYYSVDSFT